jgi:hypothetical protein
MKIFYLAVIVFCFAIFSNVQNVAAMQNSFAEKAISVKIKTETNNTSEINKARKVTVSVFFKNSYCGGAVPPKSVLEQYKTEYPLKNSTILLKDTSGNGKTIKIRTNSKGIFKTKLKPGTYNFFMTKKYNKDLGFDFTSSCDIWLQRSFGQITIIEGQTDGYKILFDYGCNPCAPARP